MRTKRWISRAIACSMRTSSLAVALAALTAATEAAEPPAHAASRELWAAAGVGAYEYAYHKFCECHEESPPETVVTVRDASVIRVHHRHAASEREVPAREGSLEYYWTVEDLFALIETGAERGATVRARYDESLGYPNYVYVDYDPDLVGDEVDVRLTRLDVDAQ